MVNPDARTELFRHGDISVTRSWLVIDGAQYAVRYVNKLSSTSAEPPRGAALGALCVCLLLAIITIVRIVLGDFSQTLGWWILVACAGVMLVAGHVAFIRPGNYSVSVAFEDGETITASMPSASVANGFQDAVRDALDQLDYHDTDQSQPTVVLASLEPTRLSPVSGPGVGVVRIGDEKE